MDEMELFIACDGYGFLYMVDTFLHPRTSCE